MSEPSVSGSAVPDSTVPDTAPLDAFAANLGANVRQLRLARGLTQDRLARAAGIPRATWSNLETGLANPTLSVLVRVAAALRVSVEELLAAPRSAARLHRVDTLPVRRPGGAEVRRLLPDPIPGIEIERIALGAGQHMSGVPHTPGTREYLTCERGILVLTVTGERWELHPGDVLSFRGDQRHAYSAGGDEGAVGYATVILA